MVNKTAYMALQEQIDFLVNEQRKIKEENNKRIDERINETKAIINKLKTTDDCDFIFDILTKKTIVGTLYCDFYHTQAAAENPNINRKIFDLLFLSCKKQLLMNKGIPFEWRVEVLKEFEGF